jgi:hypothetical protein
MLRRVDLVRTDVSEGLGASFIRVTRIRELGTTQAATSNRRTLRRYFFAAYVGCYTWRRVEIKTPVIMQFSPPSRHSKYLVLIHSQSGVLR